VTWHEYACEETGGAEQEERRLCARLQEGLGKCCRSSLVLLLREGQGCVTVTRVFWNGPFRSRVSFGRGKVV
jgi:hypothetical protein